MYLEDVLVGLKYQNWTEDELPCLNQTLVLIRSLQNFTLWAVWEWDSVSSQPLGLLSGNRYQLGNFDQCMNPPWMSTYPEVESQYCLAEVSLERSDHAKKRRLDDIKPYENALDFIQHHTPNVRPLSHLTWGACVPSVCQPRSVERLVSAVLARSHLSAAGLRPRIAVSEPCQQTNSPRKFDALFYAFVSLMVVLALICLMCTIINAKRKNSNSLSYNVCKAFCLKENSKDLLKMQKDGIEVIYGIRYLTICFIVMCHQAGMLNSGPISNGIGVDKEVTLSPFAIFILHDDVFVDTFFVISGFLMAKTITAYEKLPNIFLLLLKRYIRLVVALAVVVFYVCAIFPLTGSGPLWERFVAGETDACLTNWWLNILMLSNYINTDNACIVVSWYIPCDFHLFALTILTYALYKRWRGFGLVCACVLTTASVITPGVVNYVNNLSAVQLFTFETGIPCDPTTASVITPGVVNYVNNLSAVQLFTFE
ncbi:nose resistant to fluoxetine protein 6-like [Ostrinia nubilalis]|uniref:nose resistant to fluoxetine protein 6-like n=1 Tax=Ostrinia nubilalis TaxID=29057 RepID=UPI0030822E06